MGVVIGPLDEKPLHKDGKIDSFHPRVPDVGNLNKTTLSEPESLSAKDLFK